MRFVAINQLTLNGVTQAPGSADEDTRDGFEHGAWSTPDSDEVRATPWVRGSSRELQVWIVSG